MQADGEGVQEEPSKQETATRAEVEVAAGLAVCSATGENAGGSRIAALAHRAIPRRRPTASDGESETSGVRLQERHGVS